jgi:acetyltransferase
VLDALFFPRSVAVIGASRKELSIGNRIIKNLQDFGYTGSMYAVNPKGEEVRGLEAHATIGDVPGEVDLVHIVIPAQHVPGTLDDCGKKGVRVAIINSAGFKEVRGEGEALEEQVLAIAKRYGLRVFGPNCQGIINTDPTVKAYCNFTFTRPFEGHISIVAQSGGVAEVLNQRFAELGVGIRMYASNGNACDISIPEIIRYWGRDEPTRVIVVYVESLADPHMFMEAAREVAAEKPVLAMKAGRTVEGAKAVSSHTGGLAGEEIATELLFQKTGVVAFRDEEEMCQAALAFASQPVPAGNRVGLITNTGGPAIIATDELVEAGLVIPPLSDNAGQELAPKLHAAASISNPIDVLATAGAEHFRAAADTLLTEEGIDSIYVNFVTPFFVDNERIARELVEVNQAGRKPILCNLMTDKREWAKTLEILREGGIPCYSFPEMAARALAAMNRYRLLRSREMGEPRRYQDVDPSLAREILEEARQAGRAWLTATGANRLLEAYRIPVAGWSVVTSTGEAVAAAEEIGFPVVVKADSPEIIHKTEVAGVEVALESAEAVGSAVERMRSTFLSEDLQFLVQEYLPDGREMIAGAKAEAGLGHLIMAGLGGIHAELLKDVSFALAPITGYEAGEMLNSLRSYALLEGFRGERSVDLATLIEVLQRLSQLVTDVPGIEELDLNPIIARPHRVCVVDVRVGI